jgi:hypothetical protein
MASNTFAPHAFHGGDYLQANRDGESQTFRLVACAGALFVAVVGAGCSSAGPDHSARGTPRGTKDPSALTEITTVSAAGVSVTFFSAPPVNGHSAIGLFERGSAYAKTSPVAPLVAQRLTAQEIYMALAPDGATAPPELVAAQADQAAMLGRSAEVRHATIDKNAIVEKDLAQCESWTEVDISSWAGSADWTTLGSGEFGGFGSESINESTPGVFGNGANSGGVTMPVLLAGCNATGSSAGLSGDIYQQWPNGDTIGFGSDVGQGQYGAWYWVYDVVGGCSTQGDRCVGECTVSAPDGLLGCLAQVWGADYFFEASSDGAVDVVTAIWAPHD